MGRMQRAGLAAEEALGEVVPVPEVEIADLWPLDADDTEEVAGRHAESPASRGGTTFPRPWSSARGRFVKRAS